jgi:molybdopterin synthase catalytic subunit
LPEVDRELTMITITGEDFDPGVYIKAAIDRDVGGIVTFVGVARDDGINAIELETYEEAALQELHTIRDEAMTRFSITSVDILHRIGRLSVGDHIILIVVGAPHRKAAFDACEYIIDRIKETVPIWKKEYTDEGTRWVSGEHS